MADKTITILAGPKGRKLLAQAINVFAEAAYPPGASECAQVAREALQDTARHLLSDSEHHQVSRRQRTLLKQAVTWYYQEVDKGHGEAVANLLLRMLRSTPVKDDEFPIAAGN